MHARSEFFRVDRVDRNGAGAVGFNVLTIELLRRQGDEEAEAQTRRRSHEELWRHASAPENSLVLTCAEQPADSRPISAEHKHENRERESGAVS